MDDATATATATASGSVGRLVMTHFAPLEADLDNVVPVVSMPLAWGAYGVTALEGDSDDGRCLIVGQEWPVEFLDIEENELSKPEMEGLHLEQFCADFAAHRGHRPYYEIAPGNVDPNKPPDFRALDDYKRPVAVDAMRLTFAQRIEAFKLLRSLRAALRAVPDQLSHLKGHVLSLWFHNGNGRPIRRDQVPKMVEAIVGYRPDPSWSAVPGIPDGFRIDVQGQGEDWRFYATPFAFPVNEPISSFMATTGFEMALSYSSKHSPGSSWDELERLLRKHDKPEIEHAVVTVGGPDRSGFLFPSEHLLWASALRTHGPELRTKHIKKIYVHNYVDGRIVEWRDGKEIWRSEPLRPQDVLAHSLEPV